METSQGLRFCKKWLQAKGDFELLEWCRLLPAHLEIALRMQAKASVPAHGCCLAGEALIHPAVEASMAAEGAASPATAGTAAHDLAAPSL